MTVKTRAEWSRRVREADLHTCQRCGDRGHVEAHHITPVYIDGCRELDLENGITLCRACHRLAHGGVWFDHYGCGPAELLRRHVGTRIKANPQKGWYGVDGFDPVGASECDRFFVSLPRGVGGALILAAVDAAGESLNEFMQNAALQRMGLDDWPLLEENS